MNLSQLPVQEFELRRKKFLNGIKKGVAIFPAAPELLRNPDCHFPYRQESNFYYLTGFEEPQSICLLSPESPHPFQMFVQPKDPHKELWEGKLWGPEKVKEVFKVDRVGVSFPETDFENAFIEALKDSEVIYYRVGLDSEWDKKIFAIIGKAQRKMGRKGRPFWPILDPQEVIGELRLFKTKKELESVETAARISAEGHIDVMKMAKPGMGEHEIEALLFHAFRARGAKRLGYESIVASGENACVLHYRANNRQMEDGDLLLVDAGAEYDYYTGDITRVMAIGGKFSEPQKEIYEAVLKAEKACIALVRPGRTLKEIHEQAIEVLTEELRKLKILKGTTQALIKNRSFFDYFPHNTSHWLGIDVHDVGKYYDLHYDRPRKLEAGMVFTIEPGLYFGTKGPARYRGIGVRIEDDILVTSTGSKVLTALVPKEIEEIESLSNLQ